MIWIQNSFHKTVFFRISRIWIQKKKSGNSGNNLDIWKFWKLFWKFWKYSGNHVRIFYIANISQLGLIMGTKKSRIYYLESRIYFMDPEFILWIQNLFYGSRKTLPEKNSGSIFWIHETGKKYPENMTGKSSPAETFFFQPFAFCSLSMCQKKMLDKKMSFFFVPPAASSHLEGARKINKFVSGTHRPLPHYVLCKMKTVEDQWLS